MDHYTYQIVGGILIFISSVVSESMPKKWRVALWIFFGLLAIGYTAMGIHLDKQAEAREDEDRKERKEEIKGLRQDMTKALTSFSGMLPLIASLNSQIAILQKETAVALEKHDPRVIADLQARASTAQQVSSGVSDQLLIALTPRVVQQLRERNDEWNSADGKEIIANANSLRQVMVRHLPSQTEQDQDAATMFAKALADDFQKWNQATAANYLETLVKKVVPSAPTALTVTVH